MQKKKEKKEKRNWNEGIVKKRERMTQKKEKIEIKQKKESKKKIEKKRKKHSKEK